MSSLFQGSREAYDLSDFVLAYCRQVGAIVDPPAYGLYDVLLPEQVAARWGVPPFLRLAFDEQAAQGGPHAAPEEITLLHYGHPLVEELVDQVREQTVCTRMYVEHLRLDKRDLIERAGPAMSFPNARLFPVANVMERTVLCHYVRFSFRANLLTDDKQELILPVWMYVQGGHAVDGQAIEEWAYLDAKAKASRFTELPPVWTPEAEPLSEVVLHELLERAKQAALEGLSGQLQPLQRRSRRFLELDEARLKQYYDDLERDLQRRIGRADGERREALEGKLTAVRAERQVKLADAREKYSLRVSLELINLLLVVQPKVALPVEIRNRNVSITRQLVWDPLRQQLEELVCDVCGRPSSRLWLCTGGHLAHEDCLLPSCVDCKRAYCRLCADQLRTCVVCGRPVCVHSVQRCPTCGRETCREHVGRCHAADGEPLLPE
ncbi:MAG: hypothetical protein JXA37_08735, partial [Chloroflexia bacterium]|nr:hypothetical protein [Chloroflexia bacterium]